MTEALSHRHVLFRVPGGHRVQGLPYGRPVLLGTVVLDEVKLGAEFLQLAGPVVEH